MRSIHDGILAARLGPPEMVDDEGIRQDFLFPPEFIGFAGHFPGEPILPAVVQIAMGTLLARIFLSDSGASFMLESICRAKFLNKLGPWKSITVHCRKQRSEKYGFDIALTADLKPASTFTLHFASQPSEST